MPPSHFFCNGTLDTQFLFVLTKCRGIDSRCSRRRRSDLVRTAEVHSRIRGPSGAARQTDGIAHAPPPPETVEVFCKET